MNFNRIFFICTMMVGMQMAAMQEGTVVVVAEPDEDPLTALDQTKSPFSTATAEQLLKLAKSQSASDEITAGSDGTTPEGTASFTFAQQFVQEPSTEEEITFKAIYTSIENDKKALENALKSKASKYKKFNDAINKRISELEQLEKAKKEQEQTSTPVIHSPAVPEPLSASAAAQVAPSTPMTFPVSAATRDRSKSLDGQSTIERDAKKPRAVSFDASETPRDQTPPLLRQETQLKLDTNPQIQKPTKPYNWKAWLGIGAGVAAAVAATVIWYFWSYQKPIASH